MPVGAQGTVDLRTVVVDSATAEPLPFANAFNLRLDVGTATTDGGLLVLPGNRPGDTVRLSYVGYRTRTVVVSSAPPDTIALAPAAADLGEVVVRAGDDYLFDLLRAVRRNRRTRELTAKTYLFLEADIDGERAEVIEAYYNGTYDDGALESLAFKKGRVGLQAVDGQYFSSTSSSRLFTAFDVFADEPLFPANPLGLPAKRARDAFELALASRYREGDADVYVVDFRPRVDTTAGFGGSLWIDRAAGRLVKVSLAIARTRRHPFLAVGGYAIGEVAMALEQTFATVDGTTTPEQLSADFTVDYVGPEADTLAVRTQTFTRAYAFGERFAPPAFPYAPNAFQDYRDVSSSTYDTAFWSRTRDFRFYDRLEEIDAFVRGSAAIRYREIDLMPREEPEGLLAARYVPWAPTRLKFRSGSHDEIARLREARDGESDFYTFGAQLYADVYDLPEGPRFHTAAVLDPLATTYPSVVGRRDAAYLNLQFDLLEIERRALARDLEALDELTPAAVSALRRQHMRAYERQRRLIDKQTLGGRNLDGLRVWAELVERELGVDNLGYYQLR